MQQCKKRACMLITFIRILHIRFPAVKTSYYFYIVSLRLLNDALILMICEGRNRYNLYENLGIICQLSRYIHNTNKHKNRIRPC